MADEAVYIGPSAASESYLVSEKILQAALDTKVSHKNSNRFQP
jgi:acetyl/propionyl-CoA carboxylase alpha subunit